MSLIDQLHWRYAVKAYDPSRKISPEDVTKITEAVRLTPTSSGLQQFRLIVVQDQAIKEQLVEGALNPECMRDCSHVLVFAAMREYHDAYIDDVFAYTAKERGLPENRFESYTTMLKKHFATQPQAAHFEHAARQAYIGLGLAIAQAAELKIDSTPAEGFNTEVVDRVLGLPEKGLQSCVLLYLGYSDPERDWMRTMKKVRLPQSTFIETV